MDSSRWALAPTKPLPNGDEVIDDLPGWPYQICLQGVTFQADHYAVEELENGVVTVTYWNDDEEDYPEGEKFGSAWKFGANCPRTSQVMYAQAEVAKRIPADRQNCIYKDWSDFTKPVESVTKHGVWVSDELNALHDEVRSTPNWRDWL